MQLRLDFLDDHRRGAEVVLAFPRCTDALEEAIMAFLALGCSICEDRVNHYTNDTKSKHSSPANVTTPHYYLEKTEFKTPSWEGFKMLINISSPLDLVFVSLVSSIYTKHDPICEFNKSNIRLVFVSGREHCSPYIARTFKSILFHSNLVTRK